ncbi:MAG: cysteine desulfurase [Bacteroidia bacterium]|nr:cysteine desulfurase [Bacteroidia bacterium]MCZ2248258.1 cysteine desulfurase [Bacteroidia bacterium]
MAIFNPIDIRKDFPTLEQKVNKHNLIYFDNGATAHKPKVVINSIQEYYTNKNSNIHRGVHTLSRQITEAYEQARVTVQHFVNAAFSHEIVFTKGTTDSINLVAYSFGKRFVKAGDEVMISAMEHHSNILPWMQLCEDRGASLKVVPINKAGEIKVEDFTKLITDRTKLVAITHVSNTLGTINPIKEIIHNAHLRNVPVLIDGAQAVPHLKVDVQDLDADFYCFSAHKMFGPTGVGVLYAKEKWLNEMPPYQSGGGIIQTVSFEGVTYAPAPLKFEAGTPHIAGGIGLATAINYINQIGFEQIEKYENELLNYAQSQLHQMEEVEIIGQSEHKAAVVSFIVKGLHPYDVGMILDKYGVAVRTGHHCTQPLMDYYKIPGTIRASLAFYNTFEEIDTFVTALKKAIKMLS